MAKDQERRIFGALSLSAEIGVAKAARVCKVSAASIHRKQQQMRDVKGMNRVPVLDWRQLGGWNINILFSLPEKRREATLSQLKKNPKIVWLAENLFSLRYEATVCCRDLHTLARVLDQVSGDSSGGLLNTRWAWELTSTVWPLKIYPIGQERYLELPGRYQAPDIKLDDLDFRILEGIRLTSDNFSVIARNLKVPPSTVHARIERFRRDGLLRGIFYYADWGHFDMTEFQIVLSGCERGAKMVKDLKTFCRRSHNIIEFFECVGSYDFKMVGVAENEMEAVEILDQLKDMFGERISEANLVRRNKLLARKMIGYDDLYLNER